MVGLAARVDKIKKNDNFSLKTLCEEAASET
jgi:hypothetical protein